MQILFPAVVYSHLFFHFDSFSSVSAKQSQSSDLPFGALSRRKASLQSKGRLGQTRNNCRPSALL